MGQSLKNANPAVPIMQLDHLFLLALPAWTVPPSRKLVFPSVQNKLSVYVHANGSVGIYFSQAQQSFELNASISMHHSHKNNANVLMIS